MYGVLSLRSHRVPSVGAFYRFLPAWLRRTAAAALTLGTIGALGAILTVMAEDPGVRVPLRYNQDKRKNPVFSRVSAFVVAYSIPFPTLIASEKSVE